MADPELGFEEFMAARWAPLYRTAYLLTGDRHQAEDLLQNALARTCVRWGSIRDKGAADAYVRRAMVNLAQRQWRRRGREVVTDTLPGRGHDHLATRADHLALWSEVRRLPARMRATVVLRYFEDLSVGRDRPRARLLGGCRQEPDPPRPAAAPREPALTRADGGTDMTGTDIREALRAVAEDTPAPTIDRLVFERQVRRERRHRLGERAALGVAVAAAVAVVTSVTCRSSA